MTYQKHNTCDGTPQGTARSRRGVTLVELLVVITILGLLAVTVLPNIGGTIDSLGSQRSITEDLNVYFPSAISGTRCEGPKRFSDTTFDWRRRSSNRLLCC